jgi:hypothetical protein
MAGRWGLDEKTIRERVIILTKALQALKNTKINWDFPQHPFETFVVTVDGVHCKIYEPSTDPGSKWFDHKSNSAGVAYEVAISIRFNKVVSIRGPFPASANDLTLFRGGKKDDPKDPAALQFQLKPGQRALGDTAYTGEAGVTGKASVSRRADSDELKQFKARAKARHETFNSRLKAFHILEDRFRHGFNKHQMVFEAVAVLCQYDLENGHGLFDI